jgi:hypothetical protein
MFKPEESQSQIHPLSVLPDENSKTLFEPKMSKEAHPGLFSLPSQAELWKTREPHIKTAENLHAKKATDSSKVLRVSGHSQVRIRLDLGLPSRLFY